MQRFIHKGFSSKSSEKGSKKGRKSGKKLQVLGALVPPITVKQASGVDVINNDVDKKEIVDNELYEPMVFIDPPLKSQQKGNYVTLMTQIYDEVAPDLYEETKTDKQNYLSPSSRDKSAGNYSHLNIKRRDYTTTGYDVLTRETGLVSEAIYDHAQDVSFQNLSIKDVPDYEIVTLARSHSAYDDVVIPDDVNQSQEKARAITIGDPSDVTPTSIPRGSIAPRVRPTIKKKLIFEQRVTGNGTSGQGKSAFRKETGQKGQSHTRNYSDGTRSIRYDLPEKPVKPNNQTSNLRLLQTQMMRTEYGNGIPTQRGGTEAPSSPSLRLRNDKYNSPSPSPNQSPRSSRKSTTLHPKSISSSVPGSPNATETRKNPFNLRKPRNMKLSAPPAQISHESELAKSPLFKSMQMKLESLS